MALKALTAQHDNNISQKILQLYMRTIFPKFLQLYMRTIFPRRLNEVLNSTTNIAVLQNLSLSPSFTPC
jgi:hypothetical protein